MMRLFQILIPEDQAALVEEVIAAALERSGSLRCGLVVQGDTLATTYIAGIDNQRAMELGLSVPAVATAAMKGALKAKSGNSFVRVPSAVVSKWRKEASK